MDITKLSLVELQSMAYENMKMVDMYRQNLSIIENRINELKKKENEKQDNEKNENNEQNN